MATEVLVPPLGQTVDTVTLISWYKKEGEVVREGEPLFAIETDKATLDIEAPAGGILGHVVAAPGDAVKALSAIAMILTPGEVLQTAVTPAPGLNRTARTGSRNPTVGPVTRETPGSARDGVRRRTFISPRARRLAERHEVPFAELAASGPGGAIIERDVRAYLDRDAARQAALTAPAISPVAQRMAEESGLPDEPLDVIPMAGVRGLIAERMAASHSQAASVTLTSEADATALAGLRRKLAANGIEVSFSDLFLHVLARGLREHPRLNASLEGDAIKVWRRIDIGLAVDTDRGLLVPVVRDCGNKGLAELASETGELAERARAGKCTPDELRGSTFTLTNLGMFGIDAFTPIINLPECAVLGVGRIKAAPAMVDGQIVGRETVWLSLTFDHRLVDGAPAARFLQRVVQLVEQPHLLLA